MEEIRNYFLSETALKKCYEELFAVSEEVKNWDICILINRKGYWGTRYCPRIWMDFSSCIFRVYYA